MRVYICSPLRGSDGSKNVLTVNIAAANEHAKWVYRTYGYQPAVPHNLALFLDPSDPVENDVAMGWCLELLDTCDALWLFGKYVSEGMKAEVDYAHAQGIPVWCVDGEELVVL